MEGTDDDWLVSILEGTLEGCVDTVCCDNGLGDTKGLDDNHVLPIGIDDIPSEVKLLPS